MTTTPCEPFNQHPHGECGDDDSSLILYRLLSNRSENGNLLEELTNVDYVMQISGDLERGQTDQLVKDLNALASIRLAFKIDAAVLKSVHKLIL